MHAWHAREVSGLRHAPKTNDLEGAGPPAANSRLAGTSPLLSMYGTPWINDGIHTPCRDRHADKTTRPRPRKVTAWHAANGAHGTTARQLTGSTATRESSCLIERERVSNATDTGYTSHNNFLSAKGSIYACVCVRKGARSAGVDPVWRPRPLLRSLLRRTTDPTAAHRAKIVTKNKPPTRKKE